MWRKCKGMGIPLGGPTTSIYALFFVESQRVLLYKQEYGDLEYIIKKLFEECAKMVFKFKVNITWIHVLSWKNKQE